MSRHLFYRNAEARDLLEIFLVAGVASILLLRFYLHLTGYPQVGNATLHISHMLYGGLFMLVAVVINLAFLGIRAQRTAALLGGIGFGVFIDELGKFITKDNNYFFRPTIGLIYAIFVALYLAFNFLSRHQKLSSEEYQLNALRQFDEAVIHHMDRAEKASMKQLLGRADQSSPITKELQAMLQHIATIPASETLYDKFRKRLAKIYARFWRRRNSNSLISTIFAVQAAIFLIAVILSAANNLEQIKALFHGTDSYSARLLLFQLVTSAVAAGYVVAGMVKLPSSRPEAFELFRRAILVNLFLTEFFIFSRIGFGAVPGFILNLALLIALRFATYQEKHRT